MSAALLLSAHGAAALTVASVPRTAAAGAARSAVVMAAGDPALIIQNKGGGHGEFGELAPALLPAAFRASLPHTRRPRPQGTTWRSSLPTGRAGR